MEIRRRGRKLILLIVIAAIVAVLTFFLVGFITKTGIFKVYGKVYYDESLNEAEINKLKTIFTDELKLERNVTISATNTLEFPATNNEILISIRVVVGDYYDLADDITAQSADELIRDDYKLIDFSELSFRDKLFKINGKYYLDDFKSGAVFRVLNFDSEAYDEEIKPLVSDLTLENIPDSNNTLTFAQTGVTALSRGMHKKLNAVGNGAYFAEGIGEFLSGFDLTHTSNESSFSDYASSSNICSDDRFMDTLLAIGLDIVELTGNHNQDCGDEDARRTIDMYNEKNIRIVGGGKTLDEARKPLEISEKGNEITMLAYNQSTGGQTYDATPGANPYNEENAASEIAAAKARGDTVIVDIQYNECTAYASEYEDPICDAADSAAGDQVGLFRHLIDLGADVVVGTSAHQPQTYELYGDGEIFYGLGNIFFDQIWWPGTTRSLILVHYFYNNKLVQTRIFPTVYDEDMQTKLMDTEKAKWFLERLEQARP